MPRRPRAALGSTLLLTVLLLTGCSLVFPDAPPAVPVLDPGPVEAESTDDRFRLTLTLPTATWPAEAAIEGEAVLALDQGAVELGGSGGGLIGFRYNQVGGRIVVDPIWTADCARHRLTATEPIRTPLAKSGGWSEDDPDAAFYREFLQADGVRLLPGLWDITAIAAGGCGDGPTVSLETTVRILVTP
jgi:hypothetical protein